MNKFIKDLVRKKISRNQFLKLCAAGLSAAAAQNVLLRPLFAAQDLPFQ